MLTYGSDMLVHSPSPDTASAPRGSHRTAKTGGFQPSTGWGTRDGGGGLAEPGRKHGYIPRKSCPKLNRRLPAWGTEAQRWCKTRKRESPPCTIAPSRERQGPGARGAAAVHTGFHSQGHAKCFLKGEGSPATGGQRRPREPGQSGAPFAQTPPHTGPEALRMGTKSCCLTCGHYFQN